jgi:DNA-directed RNA polymerase specialized sigma24 family protein
MTSRILHNKLYQETKDLAPKIKGWRDLDEDQQQSVITDSFMSVLNKMNEGTVNYEDYSVYKGYLFLAIRNNIFKIFHHKNHTHEGIRGRFWIEETNLEDHMYPSVDSDSLYQELKLKDKINKLKPFDRAIFRFITKRGWSAKWVAAHLNIPHTTLNQRMSRIKRQLRSQVSF